MYLLGAVQNCVSVSVPATGCTSQQASVFARWPGWVRQVERPGWAGLGFHFGVSADRVNALKVSVLWVWRVPGDRINVLTVRLKYYSNTKCEVCILC